MIKFASKHLPALMKFMAKNDLRYYLNGIHITPDPKGGAILVATDGHRILVIKDKDAVCKEDVIFSIDKGVEKYCKASGGYVTIDPDSQRLTIFADVENELFLQPGKCLIVGKFPNWQRCMPDFTKLTQASLSFTNPLYIAEACMIHPSRGKGYGIGCRFWQESKVSPMVVEYNSHPEYVAIIIGVRIDDAQGTEEWLKVFGNPKAEYEASDAAKRTPK